MSKVAVTCACGQLFEVAQWQLAANRGKYCSRACLYEYRTRPSGLVYKIVKDNPGWIKPGIRHSPDTEFQVGAQPHNWKGDEVGYDALHDWVKRHAGKATLCCFCGSDKNVQWANKSWLYKRDLLDWIELCYKCHREYDMNGQWGSCKDIFVMNETNQPGVRI